MKIKILNVCVKWELETECIEDRFYKEEIIAGIDKSIIEQIRWAFK